MPDDSLLILTEGVRDALRAKTAVAVMRYGRRPVAGLIDSTAAGSTAQQTLGAGGDTPVFGSVERAPGAATLLVGIAPPGGRLPEAMRRHVLDAIERGMRVESGLHEFLADDPELAAAAQRCGAELVDVRRNEERDVAGRRGIDERCYRLQTIGNDISVGKMVAAVETARAMAAGGTDAKFVATGQTGIMVEGDGCPIDRVIADFVNGAAEKLVLTNQHHELLVIEGQGSLVHPRYSSVTLGLLHGCMPDGLILCYEAGRRTVHGMDHVALPPLAEVVSLYEHAASVAHPCRVVAAAVNGRRLDAERAEREKEWAERELGVPACDVMRDGPGRLVEAAMAHKRRIGK